VFLVLKLKDYYLKDRHHLEYQIHFVNQFTIIKSYKVARCHFCFIFADSNSKPIVFEDLMLTNERFQN